MEENCGDCHSRLCTKLNDFIFNEAYPQLKVIFCGGAFLRFKRLIA